MENPWSIITRNQQFTHRIGDSILKARSEDQLVRLSGNQSRKSRRIFVKHYNGDLNDFPMIHLKNKTV
jgi:hypothetical protein